MAVCRIPCGIDLATRRVLRRSSWLMLSLSIIGDPAARERAPARRTSRSFSSLLTFLKTFHSRKRLSYIRLLPRSSVVVISVMVKARDVEMA